MSAPDTPTTSGPPSGGPLPCPDDRTYSVYELRFSDGSRYVGVSNSVEIRFRHHTHALETATHKNASVSAAFAAHGLPLLSVLASNLSREVALERERDETRDYLTDPLLLNRQRGGALGGDVFNPTRPHDVYALRFLNGAVYYGVSTNAARRYHRHLLSLRRGEHANRRMQAVFEECGEPAVEILHNQIPKDDALAVERELTASYESDPLCLNRIRGGGGWANDAEYMRDVRVAAAKVQVGCPYGCDVMCHRAPMGRHVKAKHPDIYTAWRDLPKEEKYRKLD
jgi:predicted GIY-YIG superfamily endonuclease